MILRSVQSVLSMVMLMGVGWYLRGQSWFGQKGADIFSKLSVKILIPAYILQNVLDTCKTRQTLLELVKGLPVPVFAILLGSAVALGLTKLLRVPRGRVGIFLNAVTFCNTVLVGFPIITSLFGEEAAAVGIVYYMANTTLFWTVGVYALRVDGGERQKFWSVQNLKKIFSAPMVGFFIGIMLVLLNVRLPLFLSDPLVRLGQCTTPVAMMFIGCLLKETDFRTIWSGREIWAIMAVRFLLSPLIMLGFCAVVPMPLLMRQVFFTMSTMPAMTQLGIMAKESGCDAHFASAAVAGTTVVCMGALPVFAMVMEWIPLLH